MASGTAVSLYLRDTAPRISEMKFHYELYSSNLTSMPVLDGEPATVEMAWTQADE